jgi:hypothetical protein
MNPSEKTIYQKETKIFKNIKNKNNYYIERKNKIIYFCDVVKGTRTFSNYIWFILLLISGIGAIKIGISSYLFDIKKNFFFENVSNIRFLPQGILLTFYGACAVLISFIISFLLIFDLGSGNNEIFIKEKRISLSRKNFPNYQLLENKIPFKQEHLYLVYKFSEIGSLELEIINGINPKRIIYLILKDGRRIPLTPANGIENLAQIELKTIYLAKLIGVNIKLNDKSY